MDSLQMSLVLLGLVLVIGTQSGLAIDCYVCNSGDPTIGDDCWHIKDSKTNLKKNCDDLNTEMRTNHSYSMCRKIYQSVEGEKRIIRDCAVTGEDRCAERTGTHRIRMTYCECRDSLCNGVEFKVASTVSLVAVVTMGILATLDDRYRLYGSYGRPSKQRYPRIEQKQ